MKKALIYCRVSSRKQAEEGHGNESQEHRCRQYAEQKALEVVRVFKDDGVSGSLFDRPAINDLLSYLDKHPSQEYVVIFDDLSRLARDVKVHIRLRAELMARNVKLECLNFAFDETEENEMLELIMATTNQYFRKQNARQVKQKMKARMENGYWVLKSPPSGLKYRDVEGHGKLLVRVEPYASIYKTAIEKFEQDILLDQVDVQAYINQEFMKAGVRDSISLSGVKSVLTEVLYTGYIEYQKWSIDLKRGKHEGFISIQTYQNVQDKLQGKKRKIIRKDYSLDFPLRGFVSCYYCGKLFTAAWCEGRSKKYPKYWCKNPHCDHRSPLVPREILEEKFLELLDGVRLDSSQAELIKVILLRTWEQEKENEAVRLHALSSEKRELETRIVNLSERISVTTDKELVAVYEGQLKQLLSKQSILENPQKKEYSAEELRTATKLVFETLEQPVRMWRNPDYKQKATILRMYFPKCLMYDNSKGFRTVELEPTIKLMKELEPSDCAIVEMLGVEPRCRKNR